jgi:signal transduction histidine kinase
VAGLVAGLAAIIYVWAAGFPGELPWLLSAMAMLGAAALVRRRLPGHPLSGWFAVGASVSLFGQLLGSLTLDTASRGAHSLALMNLFAQLFSLISTICFAHLFGLFPDGRIYRRFERHILRASWWLLLVPAFLLVATPVIPLPDYFPTAPVVNPFHLLNIDLDGDLAYGLNQLALSVLIVVGVVMLVLRYRRFGSTQRRQIRWLLLPAFIAAFAVPAYLLFDWPNWFFSVLYIGTTLSIAVSLAFAFLSPQSVDVDRVLRRSLVYGALWLAITAVYVGAAAALGLAVGQRLTIGWAITLTVVATLALQPVRAWLERIADRWVFGAKTDPTRVIERLGATLEDTYELESLLPLMATALEDGLGLQWARVVIAPYSPADEREPVLTVPIVLRDERLGVVECGPKTNGEFTDEDKGVVATLARQAALAVRNVRLTTRLSDQAAELAASRARLVRAEEAGRRRMERNIHDGIQQDLVALIGQAGRLRTQLEREPDAVAGELALLQSGLERVLGDLRELASGIHPSLLRDRGLLAAVEALAARNPVPVLVRADLSLRGLRLAEELEGAGYYTVAESLANSLKHAEASQVEVTLERTNGSLHISIRDDGRGFDEAASEGQGLANLSERLAALGGRLDVTTSPGQGTTVSALFALTGADGKG